MKRKIAIALILVMCITLSIIFTGCKLPIWEANPSDGTTNTENNASAENGTDNTPAPSESTEQEQPSTLPEDTEQATDPKPKTDTLLLCTASSLNIRKGPATTYDILGTINKNDMVMPISKTDNWYEIWYLGESAYASASYLTEVTFEKASDEIEQVITEGKKLIGIPYEYGAPRYHYGNGSLNPNFDGKSFDCSSLMQYIFKLGANINLAMTSRDQGLQGKEIARSDIKRGDLLFFTNSTRVDYTGLERIGHVALYLGDNIILHTASDYAIIEPISATRESYFITARRMFE